MAATTDEKPTFKEKQRVEAVVDLPGVPAGTRGRVIEVSGLTWLRYRVDFESGHSLNLIDGSKLKAAPRRG